MLGGKGQSLDGRDQDDTVIIPLTTAQRKVFGTPFLGSVRMIMVQAESAEAMPEVEADMTALLRQRHRLREGQPERLLHAQPVGRRRNRRPKRRA